MKYLTQLDYYNKRILIILVTLFIIFISSTQSVEGKSLQDKIEDAETYSNFLYSEAAKHGYGASWLGTAYNELGIPEISCAILGQILDRKEYVSELDSFEVAEPSSNMSEEELMSLLVSARWLENWAYTAKRIISLSKAEQVATWNLDCIGNFEIPSRARIRDLIAKTKFRIDGSTLFILGDIETGFAEDFAKMLASKSEIETVALGSSGGSVYDALKAGMMIRALNLNTTLSNNCYSACPLVFLGGVSRTIWSPYPALGFHQMYVGNGLPLSPLASEYNTIREYVRRMGANDKFVVAAMFAAQPNAMFVPKLQELCDNNVATGVQRVCVSTGLRHDRP